MNRYSRAAVLSWAMLLAAGAASRPAVAQADESMVAISADVVEISGSSERDLGFNWGSVQNGVNFGEVALPGGIFRLGDFARQTALQTSLKLLETEGKAQILSNPKVIVQSGAQANFVVGGEQPYPVTNNQGVGVEFKKYGVILNVVPVINPNKKDAVRAEMQLEVSAPDASKTVQVGNTSVPSMTTRQLQTAIELKSGETLVIGGLKSSSKNVTKTRVPFLGRIPLLGLLFSYSSVVEQQTSLYLFITMEIVK